MSESQKEQLEQKKVSETALDELLTEFSKSQDKEVLHKIVPVLGSMNVLVPAAVPEGFDKEMLEKLKKGARLERPKGVNPMPALLQTNAGGKFFGVYTSQKHVPVKEEYPLLMDMRFVDCCKMASKMQMDGIVVNAFSQNLTFKKQAVDAFVRDFPEGKPRQLRKVKLTREQFEDITRKSIELKLLPKYIFEGGESYVNSLCEEKEELLAKLYSDPFQKLPQSQASPYTADDFSVMDLNVAEDIMLVRLDLPEKKLLPGSCKRIYVTMNPQTKAIRYFTIQKGKEKDEATLGEVGADGKGRMIGEAPEESVELQRIIDLVHFDESQLN